MKYLAAAICCVWAFPFGSGVAAAPQDSRSATAPVEVWGAASGVITGPSADTTSAYSPPLLFDGAFISRAGQTLAADARAAIGVAVGLNVFPTNRFGFQVLAERATCEVSAVNAPYTIVLQYVSRPPPSGEPQTVTLNQSIAWPDTSGSLTQWTFAFNAIARVGAPDRVSVTLSAGAAHHRVTGEVQPLGFTTFQLGGHSVLFQNDYRLAASVGPAHVLGFDAGAEVNAPLGPHAAIITGYRYLGSGHIDVVAKPARILNAGEVIQALSVVDIVGRLGPVHTRLATSGSRLFVGLKLRLGARASGSRHRRFDPVETPDRTRVRRSRHRSTE